MQDNFRLMKIPYIKTRENIKVNFKLLFLKNFYNPKVVELMLNYSLKPNAMLMFNAKLCQHDKILCLLGQIYRSQSLKKLNIFPAERKIIYSVNS